LLTNQAQMQENMKFIKKHGNTNRKNSETYVSSGCSYKYWFKLQFPLDLLEKENSYTERQKEEL